MFQNNLKIALRNLLKQRTFTLLTLAGLSVGLATSLAIALYVWDEMTYEAFHQNHERIHRLNTWLEWDGDVHKLPSAPNKVAPFAKEHLAAVEAATRVFHHNFGDKAFVRVDDENFIEPHFYWADTTVFDVFSFQFLHGKPEGALARPGTVVLSRSAAKKWFGVEQVVGKTIRVDNALDLEITGVYDDIPANTHLPFSAVAAFSGNWFGKESNQSWSNASFFSFLLLHPGATPSDTEAKLKAAIEKHVPADERQSTFHLQALDDIHLRSGDLENYENTPYGDLNAVRILIGLALLVLLIACINYMNLATARSQHRFKEVGVSKVLGAAGGQMARRFYVEAGLLVLFAMLTALAMVDLSLPVFNGLTGKQVTHEFLAEPSFWLAFAGLWCLVTLVAGAYPALYLSRFSPKHILMPVFSKSKGATTFRKGLVVFQFGCSIVLIVSAFVFQQQLHFIQNKKLGFEPEQVVAISVAGVKEVKDAVALKNEITQVGSVNGATLAQGFPGMSVSGRNIVKEGAPEGNEGIPLATNHAQPEVLDVLKIKLLAGRLLPEKAPGDTTVQVVVNEVVSNYLGLTPAEAIGKSGNIQGFSSPAEIVGVVENFNHESLHKKVEAYAFHNAQTEPYNYLLVRLGTGQLAGAMKQLETTFKRVAPTTAFDFVFLDSHLDTLYRAERRLAKVMGVFAGLAIFVACLGLFALAAFSAEQRTKEIGVRKVLGASVAGITVLLSKDFLKLVVVSLLLASPIAWYFMKKWLEDFEYRIEIQWWVFVAAGLAAVGIAFFTVSFQSIKAALTNPIKSLRSE